MEIALLVIDMQRAFFEGAVKTSMTEASKIINEVVDLFREHKKKVIWIYHENPKIDLTREKENFKVISLLKPKKEEETVIKRYGNSFNKTGLYEYLAREKINTLILTGYRAERCLLSTYRGALDLDLAPIMLKGALAGGNPEYIKLTEDLCEIISPGALGEFLKYK